jgi:hypothetical protein
MKSDEWIKIAVVAIVLSIAVYVASKGVTSIETGISSIESNFSNISPLWLLAVIPLLILVGFFFV